MSAHKCGADGVRDTGGSGGDDGEPWLAVAVVMKTDVSGGGKQMEMGWTTGWGDEELRTQSQMTALCKHPFRYRHLPEFIAVGVFAGRLLRLA